MVPEVALWLINDDLRGIGLRNELGEMDIGNKTSDEMIATLINISASTAFERIHIKVDYDD